MALNITHKGIQAKGKKGDIEFKELPLDLLDPCDWNPNKMSKDKFNALFENISEEGMIEPIVVRPMPDGRYEIIGGHHRYEVCKILGWSLVPCMVKHGMSDFDVECQNMRLNVIKGNIDPSKFTKMYQKMCQENPEKNIAEMLGIVSQDELAKLIIAAKEQLPDELKTAFDKAKKDIKTLDDLVLVINDLFTRQGDTLEKFSYMILDFDGHDSIWVRMSKTDMKAVEVLKELCYTHSVSMDSVIRQMLTTLTKGTSNYQAEFFKPLPKVDLSNLTAPMPLESNLAE